jgi:hypothetical protein
MIGFNANNSSYKFSIFSLPDLQSNETTRGDIESKCQHSLHEWDPDLFSETYLEETLQTPELRIQQPTNFSQLFVPALYRSS